MIGVRERYEGCMLGLAAGDALGTAVEFRAPGSFPPVTGMTGGGPFGLQPGQWTDDTSMALCLAESLITCGGFDAGDQMRRYQRWRREGYLSSTGTCFDIGNTVAAALDRFARTADPYAGSADAHSAGNGSLMRLAPVPLFFAADPASAIARCAESSRTTHGALTCLDACRYFGGLLVGAVQGRPKAELLAPAFSPVPGLWEQEPLCPEIAQVALGSFREKAPPQIVGTGYVVRSLEAALWAFDQGATYEEGALLAVNLGQDADTTAAIYGQLAGACYGVEAIPAAWRARLCQEGVIRSLAQALMAAAQV